MDCGLIGIPCIELSDIIRTSYGGHPTRFSIDLIQAALRQKNFINNILKIDWTAPEAFVRAIRRYSDFLKLIAANSGLLAVPTMEIGNHARYAYHMKLNKLTFVSYSDLAWHTQMLFGSRYRAFTLKYVGRVVNHDDNILADKLKKHAKKTNIAWKEANMPYQIAGVSTGFRTIVPTRLLGAHFGDDYRPGTFELPEETRFWE